MPAGIAVENGGAAAGSLATVAVMSTRILGPADVATYREIRLEALRGDPHAFCSTLERESAFDDATMVERLTSYDGRPGAVIVDDTPRPAGMVGVGLDVAGDVATLWGMWVRPDARRTGLGRRLVAGAVDWAEAHGAAALDLWVVVGNGSAIALYERCGFAATGAADVVPGRPGVAEVEMRRRLGPS